MNSDPFSGASLEQLPEEKVAAYLQQHPDFFIHHESLLTKMDIPHGPDAAISLVERQVRVLRDENQQLQRQINTMIEAAKRNEVLNVQIQHLVTALLEQTDLDAFFDTLYQSLNEEFNTDAVIVRLFDVSLKEPQIQAEMALRQELTEYDAQVFNLFENVLNTSTPLCGRLTNAQAAYLFPELKLGSAVLIPLGTPKPQGILALGSLDVARFYAGMSTDLLSYMGKLVSQMLRRWQV
ncbi:DUF484 family protein [Candidatus Venteria ishoeyi]|uniref:DUF484 family protein n=1 Tax=Candidatus Venteria ishoeyi TaxID=1899563 RepID=UPI0025A67766|nr:DUF484 family protein [Candidatus Venteria ishoeyi]MDM8545190.1 DUF484 family protein [Candidatus Venteria ishoeyi]